MFHYCSKARAQREVPSLNHFNWKGLLVFCFVFLFAVLDIGFRVRRKVDFLEEKEREREREREKKKKKKKKEEGGEGECIVATHF